VNTYGAPWSYIMGSMEPLDTDPDPAGIDAMLREKTSGGLRMLDGVALRGIFNVPAHIRRAISLEKRIYTLDEPPRFFGKGVGAASGRSS
jgi:spermidine synthase